MVAKFLDDNKPKREKVDLPCVKLHRCYLISFNLSNVGENFWVKSERTLSKFRKRKRNFLRCAHLLNKAAREIRKFHVAVVQQRLRNVQKSVMHVQSCFFGQSKPVSFYCSPSPSLKLPMVVIKKFWYHSNVTSHFTSLLCAEVITYCLLTHTQTSPVELWRR